MTVEKPYMLNNRWQNYFFRIAEEVGQNSTCSSRQVGAILVLDKIVIATGYNGPPRGFAHCTSCPRRGLPEYAPGKFLNICPATHAEVNCLASAARLGVAVRGACLFINTQAPCKNCMAALINAGVYRVYCLIDEYYDELGERIARECGVSVVSGGKEI